MIARRITKNFFFLFSGNVISQIIVFYGFVRLANILSIEDFGRFSFAQAIMNFFVRFTEFGMETTGIRRITQKDNYSFLVENVLFVRLFFSIVVILIVYLIHISKMDSKDIQVIFILLISLIGISITLEWHYQAYEKMGIIGFIRTIRSLLIVVPLLVLSKGSSVIYVSWLYSFSFLIVSLYVLYLYVKRNDFFFSQITLEKIIPLIKECAPIGISITLMQIPYYYSTFIIGVTMSKADVGAFSAAYRPTLALWSFGVIAAYQAFFPVINSLIDDKSRFEKILMNLTRIFIVTGLLIFLVLAPFGQAIINILYGAKYSGTEYIMQLSLIIIAIVLGRSAVEYSMLSLKMQKGYLRGMILVSSLYITLCYWGAVHYGIYGVICASIGSELVYTGYVLYQVLGRDKCKEYIILFLKGIFLGFVSYMIILLPIFQNKGMRFCMSLLVFSLGVWLLKIVTINEWNIIKKMFAR
jgi:O-antigen/teichoic acid export membrane protein